MPRSSVRESSPHSSQARSEEHTSELQSQSNLVCRLLLEKKKKSQRHIRIMVSNGCSTLRTYLLRPRSLRTYCTTCFSLSYSTSPRPSTTIQQTSSLHYGC